MLADIAAQQAWRRRIMPASRNRGARYAQYTQAYHDQLVSDMAMRYRKVGDAAMLCCVAPESADLPEPRYSLLDLCLEKYTYLNAPPPPPPPHLQGLNFVAECFGTYTAADYARLFPKPQLLKSSSSSSNRSKAQPPAAEAGKDGDGAERGNTDAPASQPETIRQEADRKGRRWARADVASLTNEIVATNTSCN